MKAVALAVSARERGNCYDFAQFTLGYLREKGVDIEKEIKRRLIFLANRTLEIYKDVREKS